MSPVPSGGTLPFHAASNRDTARLICIMFAQLFNIGGGRESGEVVFQRNSFANFAQNTWVLDYSVGSGASEKFKVVESRGKCCFL